MRVRSATLIAALVAAFVFLRPRVASAEGLVLPDVPGDDYTEAEPLIGLEETPVSSLPTTGPRLSEHFTVAEFTASRTAAARGIDNDLPIDLLGNARATAAMLERIRSWLTDLAGRDVPIIITSGYRSRALNEAIGGSPRSDHMQALAADWRAPEFGSPVQVAQALAGVTDELGIGQLINEFPDRGTSGWVHTSIQAPARAENAIITVTAAGTFPGIVVG